MNDFEKVFSVVGREEADRRHPVADACPAEFTWDYGKGSRPKLDKLYEKAKRAQWNGSTDLPWETEVDQEALVAAAQAADVQRLRWSTTDFTGTRGGLVGRARSGCASASRTRTGCSPSSCTASRGPCCARPRSSRRCPWIDAKYYAATQVVDEARHVEVFSRYLDEKLSGHYPINAHLGLLLDDIIADRRWDMTYLGMQIMVEGLALAAFGFMHQMTTEPLLKKLLRYVMADEARHVAFGVLSLQELYQGLSAAELRERQEFAFEAAVRMRDRHASCKRCGSAWACPGRRASPSSAAGPERDDFQVMLFSKIVPNLKKLGLLDAADGWLRAEVHRDGGHRLRGLRRHRAGGRRLGRRLPGRPPGGLSRSPRTGDQRVRQGGW